MLFNVEGLPGLLQARMLFSDAARRLFDVVAAAAVLICLAPLMVFIVAAIVAEDGRPILFSQLRLGRRGRHFRMYKFRKFHEGSHSTVRALTMENDPRLTRVGGFLARTKLDELPQLWNVLKGDMSVVGPRPESRDFEDCFEGSCAAVLKHKPGIFGPSQVLFRNECSLYCGRPDPEQFYRNILFRLKAQIDTTYFAHRTLLGDFAWVFRGVLAVFGRSSLARQGAVLVAQTEHWIKQGGPPAGAGLIRIGRWGGVEIVRLNGCEIAASPGDRRDTADPAGSPKGEMAQVA